MSKILSIIIPSCNMERYLRQCLDSLLIDSLDALDILVINDGSKDKTSEIGHTYADRYPGSIRVIDKPNGHYGSCINRGLSEAVGKYIRVLDADDSFDPKTLELFIKFLSCHDADLILSDYCTVNENYEVTSEKKFPNLSTQNELSFQEALPLLTNEIMAMHGVTYRTSLLREINYRQTEGVAYTDQEWIFIPILNVKSILTFPHIIYKYLVGREGQSIDNSVITKAMSLQLKHFSKRLDDFELISSHISTEQKEYAFNRMRYSMINTFKCILFGRTTQHFIPQLAENDSKLKEIFPELYYALDDEHLTKKLPFKYIKYWRRRYHQKNKTPIISLIRRLAKLSH